MCQKPCEAQGSQHPAGTDPNLAALVWLLKQTRLCFLRHVSVGLFPFPCPADNSEPAPCLWTNLSAVISDKLNLSEFLENPWVDKWANES